MAAPSPESTNELFATAQAASYLGCTEKTLEVWRCTKRHQIPYLKIGRLVRYRKADLDAFLATCLRDAADLGDAA